VAGDEKVTPKPTGELPEIKGLTNPFTLPTVRPFGTRTTESAAAISGRDNGFPESS
jgi:hypothetical protein